MYTVCAIPPDRRSDAPGLSLNEAFARIMALSGRHYAFVRTARVMQLLMTEIGKDEPMFLSEFTHDETARHAIMAQVCAHGLGRFRVLTDEQYRLERMGDEQAA